VEGVSGLLHLLTVVGDREIALSHGVEGVTQVDRSQRPIGLEVVGDRDPQIASCLILAAHGEVEDGIGDGAVESAANAEIRLLLGRLRGVGGGWRSSVVNVLQQPELAAHRAE
jgi:hypothetical protein